MKSRTNFQARIYCLFVITLLLMPLCGCITSFQQSKVLSHQSPYLIPDLPKSELATIQIDTNWIQHNSLFALAINKKVALREKIRENKNQIFLVPGTHDMVLLLIAETQSGKEQQSASGLSIEVKADSTYLLTAEYANDTGEALCFQLIDTDTQEVVSQPQTKSDTTSDYIDFQNYSFQFNTTWHF